MLPAAMTAVTCIGILGDHREEWERALQHSFLQSCRDGSLTPEAFNTWLIQVITLSRGLEQAAVNRRAMVLFVSAHLIAVHACRPAAAPAPLRCCSAAAGTMHVIQAEQNQFQ